MRWRCRSDAGALLREVWRVLAAGGRLLAVVPNRRGLWARMDTTPFGHGRPYSRSQITQLLRETWFTPTGWSEALYVPPIARGWFLRSAVAWERTGATLSAPFAGVHIVEATKQVYRAIPARREQSAGWCRRSSRRWRRRPAASTRHDQLVRRSRSGLASAGCVARRRLRPCGGCALRSWPCGLSPPTVRPVAAGRDDAGAGDGRSGPVAARRLVVAVLAGSAFGCCCGWLRLRRR